MSLSSISDPLDQWHSVWDTASKGREVIQKGKVGHRDDTPGIGLSKTGAREAGIPPMGDGGVVG